ncbi:probable carboxylesterase 18 [Phragmites australis]|uniref:probable carboxylesterase 18 n=1 Tax=Phragmites australis TaxID=29695 RepID=UPI002D76A2DF|nr:probable carboxylesterase 18 [Phragmites australis]
MEASKRQETARAPALPWTVRFQIFGLVAAASVAQRLNGTVNRSFFSLVDRHVRASARPDKFGVRSDDVDVDASRGLWARVFKPSEAQSPLPVVVYFHGGGFALLSAASVPYDNMCRRFCRELGAVVLSVNYRLAPEHRYPAAYDDGVDVLGYLEKNRLQDPAVQVDLSACFVAGDSAGGNIAHHVAQRWTAAKSKSIRLAGTILVQPFFGGEERTESERRLEGVAPIVNMRRSDWSWRAFLPEGADRNHRAAHLTSENADLAEGFPPAMVVIGGFDPEKDWQRRYADLLQQKGKAVQVVEFPEAIHGFFLFPKLPDAGNLVKEIKAFMDKSKASASSA